MNDKAKIEKCINDFYRVLSGRKNKKRNWGEYNDVFVKRALLSVQKKENGNLVLASYGLPEYVERLKKFLSTQDFYEASKKMKS